MKTKIMVLASIMVMLGVNAGWAQVEPMVRVDVPFDFTVGSKVLPAGLYDITREALGNAVRVASVKGGPSGDIVIVSRLWAKDHETPGDSHVVFHQTGAKHIFAELWIPGTDGLLLSITKEKHNYESITVHR